MQSCPLCNSDHTGPYYRDKFREYFQCCNCYLVFVPKQYQLSLEQEKAEYDLHQNKPDDYGYRAFLSRLGNPLQTLLNPGSCGLDFGCGPGPTLSRMFEENGYKVDIYDPFYANNSLVFENKYDFITATEVVEHLRHPAFELDRLFNVLNPGSFLGIMTKLVIDHKAFQNWHYKNDLTHICFYSKNTFEWLAQRWDASLTCHGNDVMIVQKQNFARI